MNEKLQQLQSDEVRLLAQQQINQEQAAAIAKQAEDLRANLAATRGAIVIIKQMQTEAAEAAEQRAAEAMDRISAKQAEPNAKADASSK